MNDVAEAAGGMAQSALAAHAIDPPAPHGARHPACLNCGAGITGAYCAHCGQSAHLHRSAGHVIEEFLHGVWHFDSKAWRTLPMLALNPGKLTRDYVHGHRQRYIAPLALFLLTIFLMFFVFGVTGSGDSIRFGGPGANVVTVADANQMLARIDRDVAAVRAKPQSPAAAAEELKPLLLLRDAVSARRARLARGEKPGFFDGLTDSVAAADKLGMVHVKPGDNALAAASRRALANPELFVDRLQQKGYKFAFLLVPLSLPWMWLAFARRRDVRLYDHVVFLLYGLSFMALLVVAAHLADLAGAGGAALSAVALIFPVHLYRQLRGAYRLSVGGALWRTGFLALSAGFTLVMYLVLVVAIGLLD